MREFLPQNDDDVPAIVKLEGTPNEFAPKERSLWQKFLNVIWPFTRKGGKWAKYGYGLSKTFIEAEVANKQNQAAKTAAEAAELSARADANRNQAAKIFNEQIDSIFKDDLLPESAKLLKLAKLLESNPDLAAQLEKVAELIESLQLLHGTSVEIQAALSFRASVTDKAAT
jgi:hypothetical protein